jgi:hypothetical protein
MSEPENVVETVDVQTAAVATPEPPTANSQQPTATSHQPNPDLDKVRELVLKAHPDVVPDLVAGSSVDELIASVEPARTAYQRIADRVRESSSREVELSSSRVGPDDFATASPRLTDSSTPSIVQPPQVPAGGGSNVVEPGDLGPTTKIAQALAARKRK